MAWWPGWQQDVQVSKGPGTTLALSADLPLLHVTGGLQVVGKPEARFFHMALQDMGIRPEEAVMIGGQQERCCLGGAH